MKQAMKSPAEARRVLWVSSVGEQASSQMRTVGKGEVHSVYEGALNLLFGGIMISVVNRPNGRGPLNLVLSDADVDFEDLARRGWGVLYGGGVLAVGGSLRISLSNAQIYRSPQRFRRPVLDSDSIRSNLIEAQKLIHHLGRLDGLGGLASALLPGRKQLPLLDVSPFSSAALPRVLSFAHALASGEEDSAVDAGVGLLGLGIGLTPSGDDLLSGALVAMILGSRNGIRGLPGLRQVASRIAKAAPGRTTLLSQNYVEQASHGRANETVFRFVEQIYTGRGGDLRRSLVDLLAFGATSGTDIATGVTIGGAVAMGGAVED